MRRIRLGVLLLAFALPGYAVGLWVTTPGVEWLIDQTPRQTSFMRYRAAERTLADAADAVQAVPLKLMSPLLICAVLKAEDRGFFRHRGFEWQAISTSAWGTLQGRRVPGGSTITQQLARNLYLTPERTLHRKLREALIARRLEAALSKDRILELYLNTIEWGEGVWGISAAARHYFAKVPYDLDAAEASFLASLVAAPRQPLEGANAERSRRVQRRVLNQLSRAGLLPPSELRHARTTLDAVAAALHAREDVRAAWNAGAEGGRPRRRKASPARVIEDECGLERELHAEAAIRQMMRDEQ